MTSPYTINLEKWLRAHANTENAPSMEAYMKNHFPFLGIRNPERVSLTKQFTKEHGFPKGEEAVRVAQELWSLPEREFHYTAIMILLQIRKTVHAAHIDVLESYIVTQSWWDTVDTVADHLIGYHLQRFPTLIPDYVEKWLASNHMWLQRTAILFQLKYKEKTDVPLLFHCITTMADSKEFFIRKAIGWALREYSKTDAESVQTFVANHDLSPLSVREALKVIHKKQGNTGI
ncbi:DNA alkylation repair protein [Paenibacillus oryzisoli]|uniref:DNA alkylation repair protein n=1 Tax=Paenibacillus oryzisoli TaxID=1850517 RepID=A0A198AQW7_9BACL|nr:DNA alkylation repair protein [Paenibacillus oryzisoli]OAS23667.1 DNA alkylation repair protein [Paenibacillus oryzisoli]